jgi:hypothetical protein
MGKPRQQPLVVEGKDDYHSLLHLLKRTGVLPNDATDKTSPIQIVEAKSKSELLKDIPTRWKEAGITAIGYVLDADDSASDPKGFGPTWVAVRHRLEMIGVKINDTNHPIGFTGRIGTSGPQIGVWIMPDNKSDGALEDFLIAQIDPHDPLFQFAREKTREAGQLPVADKFADSDMSKAELRCWL